jgi:hypothetical protein
MGDDPGLAKALVEHASCSPILRWRFSLPQRGASAKLRGMLELRPSCEHCQRALPPDSEEALICSFECTFCSACVVRLQSVCPNCGGNLCPRPIRPHSKLTKFPASTQPTYKPVDLAAHAELVARVGALPPAAR